MLSCLTLQSSLKCLVHLASNSLVLILTQSRGEWSSMYIVQQVHIKCTVYLVNGWQGGDIKNTSGDRSSRSCTVRPLKKANTNNLSQRSLCNPSQVTSHFDLVLPKHSKAVPQAFSFPFCIRSVSIPYSFHICSISVLYPFCSFSVPVLSVFHR